MQEYFPRPRPPPACSSVAGAAQPGISTVCTVCAWTTAWTTLLHHVVHTTPRYNKSWQACLSPGCLGRSGGLAGRAGKGPGRPSWPTRGPRQQASPGLLHAGQNKVLPRQEAGIGSSYVLLSSPVLPSPNPLGLEEAVGGRGAGVGTPWRRWRDCFFPAKFGRARRREGKAGSNQKPRPFPKAFSRRNSSHQGHQSELSSRWSGFSTLREASLGQNLVTLWCVGSVYPDGYVGQMPCMHFAGRHPR